jgi:hypothetical protein
VCRCGFASSDSRSIVEQGVFNYFNETLDSINRRLFFEQPFEIKMSCMEHVAVKGDMGIVGPR